MAEYPISFEIDGDSFKAIDHIIKNDILSVLCEPIRPRGSKKIKGTKNSIFKNPRWFDVTFLPDNVCEFYYSKYTLKG